MRAVSEYCPMTAQEEQDAAIRGDTESLIRRNIGLAVKLARKKTRLGIELDDAIGIALIGLVKAAKMFSPGRGRFTTYAWRAIVNELAVGVPEFRDLIWRPHDDTKNNPAAVAFRNLRLERMDNRDGDQRDIPVNGEDVDEQLDLVECLKRLPENERTILQQRYIQGRSLPSLGREYGRHHRAIWDREQAALRHMRELMGAA